MNTAPKKNFAAVFLLCTAGILLLVCVALLALYRTQKAPAFNAAVDALLADTVVPAAPPAAPERPAGAELRDLVPQFIGRTDTVVTLDKAVFPRTAGAYSCTLEDDGYTLVCLRTMPETAGARNIVQRLLNMSAPRVPAETQEIWRYSADYPIVCTPCFGADSVVFITAEPRLVVLDLDDGTAGQSVPCPVYPASSALLAEQVYYFDGRNGDRYAFSFSDTEADRAAAFSIAEAPDTVMRLSDIASPNEAFADSLSSQLSQWLSAEPPQEPSAIEPVLLSAAGEAASLRYAEYDIAVFSPEEQGIYTVGLSDAQGMWKQQQAAAAVFTRDGEMVQSSLDYVSDRPQITLHLSDTEVYYLVIAALADGTLDDGCYFCVKRIFRD